MVAIAMTIVICISAVTIVAMVCSSKRLSTMDLMQSAIRRLNDRESKNADKV